jgi:hypothetical protein
MEAGGVDAGTEEIISTITVLAHRVLRYGLALSAMPGQFLLKDVVLLGAAI